MDKELELAFSSTDATIREGRFVFRNEALAPFRGRRAVVSSFQCDANDYTITEAHSRIYFHERCFVDLGARAFELHVASSEADVHANVLLPLHTNRVEHATPIAGGGAIRIKTVHPHGLFCNGQCVLTPQSRLLGAGVLLTRANTRAVDATHFDVLGAAASASSAIAVHVPSPATLTELCDLLTAGLSDHMRALVRVHYVAEDDRVLVQLKSLPPSGNATVSVDGDALLTRLGLTATRVSFSVHDDRNGAAPRLSLPSSLPHYAHFALTPGAYDNVDGLCEAFTNQAQRFFLHEEETFRIVWGGSIRRTTIPAGRYCANTFAATLCAEARSAGCAGVEVTAERHAFTFGRRDGDEVFALDFTGTSLATRLGFHTQVYDGASSYTSEFHVCAPCTSTPGATAPQRTALNFYTLERDARRGTLRLNATALSLQAKVVGTAVGGARLAVFRNGRPFAPGFTEGDVVSIGGFDDAVMLAGVRTAPAAVSAHGIVAAACSGTSVTVRTAPLQWNDAIGKVVCLRAPIQPFSVSFAPHKPRQLNASRLLGFPPTPLIHGVDSVGAGFVAPLQPLANSSIFLTIRDVHGQIVHAVNGTVSRPMAKLQKQKDDSLLISPPVELPSGFSASRFEVELRREDMSTLTSAPFEFTLRLRE
jgi:hypothetical protein